MTEQSSCVPDSSESTANECKDIDGLLEWVIGQISRFDALKLDELKTELEEFKKIQEEVPAEYKAKYEDFQKRWCAENEQIEQIRTELICSYGNNWKEIIKNTVCSQYTVLHDLKEKIENCKGENEKKRDKAQEELVTAKDNLDAWKTITQKIEEDLNTNQGLIVEIQNLNQGEDRAFRLYLLWFKLLPAHNKLTPDGKQPLHPEEAPEALCGEDTKQGQKADQSQESHSESQLSSSKSENTSSDELVRESPCREDTQQEQKANQTQDTYSKSQQSSGKPANNSCDEAREAPWIIKPDTYTDQLNSAFCCYKSKKEKYADSVKAFEADPDSLARIIEDLEQKKNSLEADIKQALEKETSPKMTDSPCA